MQFWSAWHWPEKPVMQPLCWSAAAALILAALTGVCLAALGGLAFTFTAFDDDDHDVSCLDSILSASSLNWLAT